MENNFSLGTYSISSDGVSINYSAPSYLTAESMQHILPENNQGVGKETDRKDVSFDDLLKGIVSVPNPKK